MDPQVLMGQRQERGCHKTSRIQQGIRGGRNETLNPGRPRRRRRRV